MASTDNYMIILSETELINIAQDISKLQVSETCETTKEFYKKLLNIIFDRGDVNNE